MKKILIIGCNGSGKTTFAIELNNKTGIEVIHLDKYYWLEGWKRLEEKEWNNILDKFLEREEWIMDGNFILSMDKRIHKADTIIFFDIPKYMILYNVFKRMLQRIISKQKRVDLNEVLIKREFHHPMKLFQKIYRHYHTFLWIWKFNKKYRKEIYNKLETAKISRKEVYILKNYSQKRKILKSMNILENNLQK